MENLLSYRTSNLCFNKDDFMSADFSVDKFVSNCRKYVPLETMLEDLGLYHKILCSAMIELINKDYADFVNLSSNLVGLDKSIKNLSFPLQKLKTEVENEKSTINENLNDIQMKFSQYSSAHKQKVLSNYFRYLVKGFDKVEFLNDSVSVDDLFLIENTERIALDLIILQYHISKVSLQSFEDKKKPILELSDTLKDLLEYLFILSLQNSDVPGLSKVLHIYSVRNAEKEVETMFRETCVRPFIKQRITEENVLQNGLDDIYKNISVFMDCYPNIFKITQSSDRYSHGVVGYDFLVNTFFPEMVNAFDLIAAVHVYAPGDPQLFHQNFSATVSFLNKFESQCKLQSSVYRLRNHASYTSFISRWNLDLYFQIRFQEIAGNFENCILSETFTLNSKENEDKYLLNVSKMLVQGIQHCWDDKIFLYHLSAKFYGLTLKLVSRFRKFIDVSFGKMMGKDDEPLTAVHLAMIIKDVEILTCDLQHIFDEKISSKVPRSLIEGSFQESLKSLGGIVPEASSLVIKLLLSECVSHLKLITDIPRLYRKTNRTAPSKPSAYVSLVFDVLTYFFSNTNSFLSPELKQTCLKEVIGGIITECFTLIADVLTSIKKMEDSLKILKRARDKPIGQTSSGALSDDDKIRRQLSIDIETIEKRVKKFGVQVKNMTNFKKLKQLVD